MASSAKFMKEATNFDGENKFYEAFVKYLEATASLCLDIAEKCKVTGVENSFSDYANQRMKLISHCYERAKSMQDLIIAPNQASSSGPAPVDSHTVKSRPAKPNPETIAKEINRNLILRHKESIRQGQYTEAELAAKEIALQKKLWENVSLAEQTTKKKYQTLPTSRRSVGKTFSNAKSEFTAGLRRSITTSFDSENNYGRRPTVSEPYKNIIPSNIEVDSDMEAGSMLPPLDKVFDPQLLRDLQPKEKLRQTSILELIHTEKTHVGYLKILSRTIYQPLQENSILPANFVQFAPCTLLALIFPNLEEILDIHTRTSEMLKSLLHSKIPIDYVGDILLQIFDREGGEKLKNAAIHFCRYQQYALDQIEECKNHNQMFNQFLSEAQSHPLSKNLTLSGQLLREMQRLSKYPLLIDQIVKYTEETETEEIQKLKRCIQCSKMILEATNSAKSIFDSWKKLTEFQLNLDTSKFDTVNHPIVREYEKFDLRNYSHIHDGILTWKQGKHKVANVQGVLLDEALVLLTKKRDKLLLKFHGSVYTNDPRTGELKVLRYCPIVVLTAVEVSDDPNDELVFFIQETNSHVPPYELSARSIGEKTLWLRHLQEQIKKSKSKSNISHEPHSLVEQTDVAKPLLAPNGHTLNDSSDSSASIEVDMVAKLIRKMKRNEGLLFNSLLNKHKYLAEILNVSPECLDELAKVIETNVGERSLRNLAAVAILQVDEIVALIANSEYDENIRFRNNNSPSTLGTVSCTSLSPPTAMLSKYLNLILASVD